VELRDIIVTPVILTLVYLIAYIVRPRVTDHVTRKYFFPALTVRIVGALAVGFIYQFYYSGGDTFTYHKLGSRVIWETLVHSPIEGINLLLHNPIPGTFNIIPRIEYFNDPASFTVVQVASIFDLITFSSYSATAILFAVFAFIGSWLMFLSFVEMHPHLHKWIAFATLFIPSVVFWGSGLLKDTITYGSLGMALYASYHLFIKKKFSTGKLVLLLFAFFLLFKIKIYILLTFLPASILWVFFENLSQINNRITRVFLSPLVVALGLGLGVFAAQKAGEDNAKYSFNKIAKTAQITAYDIRYWSGKDAGSGYSLGELDGTYWSMFKLAPNAVVVSLFRPYIWEVRNPLMLISSLEAFGFLAFFILIIVRNNFFVVQTLTNATVIFCLSFSLCFAFAVGVSTFNFGTLVRYKIPGLPFFMISLVLINDYAKKARAKVLLGMPNKIKTRNSSN
jgi:hypothetical protein